MRAAENTKDLLVHPQLIADLLNMEGIIKYTDAYLYADAAVNELAEEYTDLFSARFQYVFIDEYQDCDEIQRKALLSLFNPQKCIVIRIGDPDQAIYNSEDNIVTDWIPSTGFLPIVTSNRYGQEIADVLRKLKHGEKHISTLAGRTEIKPVLLVYNVEKIDRVIGGFIRSLEAHGLRDQNGIYKAIGAVKKESTKGLKIGSYWSGFDGNRKKQGEYNYWVLIDEICAELLTGNLYRAELIIRKLLCRIFHFAKIKHPKTGKELTVTTIKKVLDNDCDEIYRDRIYALSQLKDFERVSINYYLRCLIKEIVEIMEPGTEDIFLNLPDHFINPPFTDKKQMADNNIFVDPRGRRIEFNTIHAVKGETHDATLYLETYRKGSTDLRRILPLYGAGTASTSSLFEYSRKLAYVGMSRPRHLLCVAMQSETYEKSNGVFDDDWEVIDLRKEKEG